MAQVYGGRWKVVRSLGQGGQGDVFEVVDVVQPDGGAYALKRIRNPRRRQRFEAEVVAIARLRHPNVVRLVDHSALGASDDDVGKQFMVMPLAAGGSLAARVKVYKGSLDGALAVARPLASALSAAHALGIVHRDVKPGNVLFADEGNDPWLSDFGICLVRDTERVTETHEVAGPWAFMAPEVEHGGRLDVTPAADVYSLGKLIFYMVSGGTVFPRELLDDPRYSEALPKGGRFHLLDLLLRRMICQLGGRLQTMAEVEVELGRIADWDRTSVASPFGEAATRRVEAFQRSVLAERATAAEAQATRRERDAVAAAVLAQVRDLIEPELGKAAGMLGAGAVLATSVAEIPREELGYLELNELSALAGLELLVGDVQTEGAAVVLQLLVCRDGGTRVTMHVGTAAPEPERRTEVIYTVVPRILKRHRKGTFSGRIPIFFVGEGGRLQPVPEPRKVGQPPPGHRQPGSPARVMATEIPSSRWPELAPHLRQFVGSALDAFLLVLERNRGQPFLN